MVRLLKQFLKNEKGQALPIVLAVLAIGGLTIVPILNYATNVLNSTRMLEERKKGVYAAGAGVDNTTWCLGRGDPVPISYNLGENINQMTVTIDKEEKGTWTLAYGEIVDPGSHPERLNVSGNITWDAGEGKYRYTLVATSNKTGNIKIGEVGARLPVGYSCDEGSAVGDGMDLSKATFSASTDNQGAEMVRWSWTKESDKPVLSNPGESATLTFYIDYIEGEGDTAGEYAWIVAQSGDIGTVGEVTGAWYIITATARRPSDGRITGKIASDIVIQYGTINIVSWQITR